MNNTSNNNNPKYLIIVTLVDGQNFTIPDGIPDKIEATVFAEARFGSESVLRSDPIRLVNSNPEFATELAWQLDRKSLHQLRIERRAIKLQVFMQTRTRKKSRSQQPTPDEPNLNTSETNSASLDATNKIELIGYTVIKIRAAQESEVPKFEWLPLLNPKFRKSSYNRPEVQLALTLTKIDEDSPPVTKTVLRNGVYKKPDLAFGSNSEYSDSLPSDHKQDDSLSNDSNKMYKTCLDMTVATNYESGIYGDRDEIIENDIQIHSKDGNFYIYDIRNSEKFTINDCDKPYKILVRIPFNSDLDLLMSQEDHALDYYFSINMFGSSIKMNSFKNLTSLETNEIKINVFTTHSSILTTYFELNPSLIIKFHHGQTNRVLGLADIQVDQLCSLDSKRRSVEGIFALQSGSDNEENPSSIHPTIGVSVVIEKVVINSNGFDVDHKANHNPKSLKDPSTSDNLNENFEEDIDELLYRSFNDTHQLTTDETTNENLCYNLDPITNHKRILHKSNDAICPNPRISIDQDRAISVIQDHDHHFCFIIDLKNFSYTQDQRLIPTLRELVVRYSYPFFGYKDTITTDASIPISPTNSIIVSGFCEFNFATTYESLYAALNEIPLHLNVLTCDHLTSRRLLETGLGGDQTSNVNQAERIVATCSLNLAEILELPNDISDLKPIDGPISKTISAPIYGLKGENNGLLQVYLCLKDLGSPTYSKITQNDEMNQQSTGNQDIEINEDYIKSSSQASHNVDNKSATITKSCNDQRKLVTFMNEARLKMESWQEQIYQNLSDEVKARENEFMKRIQQKFDMKDSKREQDYKAKMKNLIDLEKRFKTSLSAIDTLEKMLRSGFEQLKTSDSKLDTRLDTIESKLTKAIDDIKYIEERYQSDSRRKSNPTEKDAPKQTQPATLVQQPSAIIPPAKKLSFYPSKYSRSSEGNLILSANNQEPQLGGLVRKTGQLNHINNTNNNVIGRAGSNTRISSGVTVIDVSPGGTKRPSVRQMTTKWSGLGTSGNNVVNSGNFNNGQTRTISSSRIVGTGGQIPKVK